MVTRVRCAALLLAASACGRTVVYQPREPAPHVQPADAGVVKPCQTGAVALSHATPAIYFVVDRSGSMAFDLKGNMGVPLGKPLEGPSRWEILWDVLGDVLPAHDRDLSIGAMFFPSGDSCGFSPVPDETPRLFNSGAILRHAVRVPAGGTPIGPVMQTARVWAGAARVKSMVLITDGEPNCNALLDPEVCECTQSLIGVPPQCPSAEICLDTDGAEQALSRLSADGGIVTHVVGFATGPSAAATLDRLAVAGGAPAMGPHRFHSAETQAELADVLSGISARETNCTWTALSDLQDGDALEVSVGGAVVPEGTGWSWLDRAQGAFVLRDTWCELAFGGAPVSAQLTCR
ncbi:MAG: hypothetical protein IPJ65_20560 [Archangiaceae bacterium]|nr:hypothetical protein [Archangiaceae bacterium]